MKFFKKLLVMLMLMGFAGTQVYAQYDDYDDDDEEVAKPKKAAKKTKQASEGGSMKLGFYGSIADKAGILGPFEGGNFEQSLEALIPIGAASRIGMLLNLGSDLEFGLGLGFFRFSATSTFKGPDNYSEENDVAITIYEIVPSASYQLGKVDFVSYGAGLNIHLASWSASISDGDETVTREPDGMDFAFYPNFFIKAEIVKNFQIWLKTGLFIYLPPEEKEGQGNYTTTTSGSIMSTKTEIGFNFFIDL